MKKSILLVILVSFLGDLGFAIQHEKVQHVKVRGEYTVLLSSSSLNGMQATQLAREDAKRKAIEKVCGSRVSTWDKAESSSAGEVFTSLTVKQVDGEVVEFTIIEEGYDKSDIRSTETVFWCVANVKVKRGVEPDPNFAATVEGVRAVYYEADAVTFTVLPYRDCYLKIFLFADEDTGYRIYPNNLEEPILLTAGRKVIFPTNDISEYVVTKDTDAPLETNRLVFVFTKEERPFYHETTSRQEIEQWMALIPNDRKFICFIGFDIQQLRKQRK